MYPPIQLPVCHFLTLKLLFQPANLFRLQHYEYIIIDRIEIYNNYYKS